MRLLKTLAMAAAILVTSFPTPASAQSTADLSVSIVGHPDPVVRGRPITWTITVSNLGPEQATGVRLLASYGSDGVPFSATTTQGTCALAGGLGVVDFSLGSIGPGGEATATVDIQAFGGDGGFLGVRVSSTANDPSRGNNTATGSVEIISGSSTNELSGVFCPPSGGVATGGGGTAASSQTPLASFGLLAMAGLMAAMVLLVLR